MVHENCYRCGLRSAWSEMHVVYTYLNKMLCFVNCNNCRSSCKRVLRWETRRRGRRGSHTRPCGVAECCPGTGASACLAVPCCALLSFAVLPCKLRLGAAFFAIVNAYFLTKGLQSYEAFFMITTVEGSMILSASLSGAIVLLDVRDLEYWRICMYSLCVMLVILGMVIVFRGEASSKSSLMSGNASTSAAINRTSLVAPSVRYVVIAEGIADSDMKDKADKAVAIPTIPPSPQGSYTGRVHAGVPPSPTTSTNSDKEREIEGVI